MHCVDRAPAWPDSSAPLGQPSGRLHGRHPDSPARCRYGVGADDLICEPSRGCCDERPSAGCSFVYPAGRRTGERSQARRCHQGIKVHGHWKITVCENFPQNRGRGYTQERQKRISFPTSYFLLPTSYFPFLHLDTQPLDLLIQRRKRYPEELCRLGLVPVAPL